MALLAVEATGKANPNHCEAVTSLHVKAAESILDEMGDVS